jgi:hypothetical protein
MLHMYTTIGTIIDALAYTYIMLALVANAVDQDDAMTRFAYELDLASVLASYRCDP